MISNLIHEQKKGDNMNTLKSIFVGVGVIMWSPKAIMTRKSDNNIEI